jgi:hypothetical protein
MGAGKIFTEILKNDSKIRLLLSGLVLDGALMLAFVIAAGIVIF